MKGMAKRPPPKPKPKRRIVGDGRKPAPRTASAADKIVKLSIAAGDPLQPAGLPTAEATAKSARAAALKSAHARFMNRPKPQK
jgi:hypothetical protein